MRAELTTVIWLSLNFGGAPGKKSREDLLSATLPADAQHPYRNKNIL